MLTVLMRSSKPSGRAGPSVSTPANSGRHRIVQVDESLISSYADEETCRPAGSLAKVC